MKIGDNTRNNARCYNYDLLKEFSEGSKALEDLLVYCYNNHVETRACCIGHNEKNTQHHPYIRFIIPKEQEYIMEKTMFW